jgi:hypothetical protein
MRLEEGKLILTEAELAELKKANNMASPSVAALYLHSYLKNKNLVEDVEHQPDVKFYTECILAYRRKSFDVE